MACALLAGAAPRAQQLTTDQPRAVNANFGTLLPDIQFQIDVIKNSIADLLGKKK